MDDLYQLLQSRLAGARRIAVLGVGSFLKADDAAGVLISEKLKERFSEAKLLNSCIFTGESAPENYTGAIKKAKPDHVIILDAAELKSSPGSIRLIETRDIKGASLSTHMFPLSIMLDYLGEEIGCGITVIGIQPGRLDFLGEVTPMVARAIDCLVSALQRIIGALEDNGGAPQACGSD